MSSRAIAFLLAALLVWAGFMSQEPPVSPTSAPTQLSGAGPAGEGPLKGSVEDHHLDDQPAQSHGENLADQPILLTIHPDVKLNALATCRPAPYAASCIRGPYLDGLQRPPCAGSRIA